MRSLVPVFRNLSAFFLFIQGFWAYTNPKDPCASCKLLKNLSTPTDCQLTVNNGKLCAKFCPPDGCKDIDQKYTKLEITHQGKLSVGTIIDPINGRLYLNGTCSFKANLTQGDRLYTFTVKLDLEKTDVVAIHLDRTPTQPPSTTAPTTLRNTTSGTESAHDRGIMYGLIVLGTAASIITAIIVGFLALRQVRAASNEAPQEPRTGPPPSTKPPVQEAVPQTRPFQMGKPSIPAIEETAHPTGDRSTLNGSDGHRSRLSVIKGSDGNRSTLSVINDSYVEDNSSGSVDSEGYAIY